MSDRIFDTPAPRLFTLPPQDDFLRKIARQLREEFDVARNPDALTDFLILTPTRRAAKALGDILAEGAGSGVALLPLIRPIGDVDVDDYNGLGEELGVCTGDLNGDGMVDAADLGLLIAAWGACP